MKSQRIGFRWRHRENKKEYRVLNRCKLKRPDTRKWIDAVVYWEKSKPSELYSRELKDFVKCFENIDGMD